MESTKEILTNYIDTRKRLEILEEEAKECVRTMAEKAQQFYWEAERRIFAKYSFDYAKTCYDFRISALSFESFEINAIFEDYYIICCSASDSVDNFYWQLKVPFDMSKLHDFVADFEEQLEDNTISKIKAQHEKIMAEERKEFERLKKQFGE